MNLKPIELQVALPRTMDAGSAQKQSMDRPVIEQQQLALSAEQQTEATRKKTGELEKTAEGKIKDESKQQSQEHFKDQDERGSSSQEEIEAPHPYKGKHIDLSL